MTSPLRWGILGSGKISSDFSNAIAESPNSTVHAIAARSEASAKEFSKKHGIEYFYEGYDALLEDEEVDIVYVGMIHTGHKEAVLKCLNKGKHVLCEKPMGMNEREVEQMVSVAREKKLFLMEGMWTRCFPATRRVVEVLSSGELGEVIHCQADLGFDIPFSVRRLYDLKWGGGGLLDLGIYPLAQVLLAFKGHGELKADQISASATLHADGADQTGVVTLKFGTEGIGTAAYSTRCETSNECQISLTKGKIRIHGISSHCPEKVSIKRVGTTSSSSSTETLDFPVPKYGLKCPMNFVNSEGFLYEVQHVEDMLRQNKTESDYWSLDETIQCTKIMDKVRAAIGVRYPQDELP